ARQCFHRGGGHESLNNHLQRRPARIADRIAAGRDRPPARRKSRGGLRMSARARFTALDFGLYAGIVFAWGFSWIALHYQVGNVPPEVSVMWRFAIAAPVMLAFAAMRGDRLSYPLSEHAGFAALGLALFSTNFLLF